MPFALMQHRLEIPSIESLQRAFRGTGGLTPADAPMVARDAYGILAKHLEAEEANALQASLWREGIETSVVNHRDLPELPMAKVVRKVWVRPEGFTFRDPYDRELVIPWAHLSVIAVGCVHQTEIARRTRPQILPDESVEVVVSMDAPIVWGGAIPPLGTQPASLATGERQVWRWVADILVTGGKVGFQIRPETLLSAGPEGLPGADSEIRFFELMRSVATYATGALLNRVAYALREGHEDTLLYPSKNAYQEELIWLLWRRQGGGR